MPIYLSTLAGIKALDLHSAHDAQARARVRWVEVGKTSFSFFVRFWTLHLGAESEGLFFDS